MPKIVILGSSNAVPDRQHENTHLAVIGEERVILIDCVGNPIVRLEQAGIDLMQITDLILTHFHPDHIAGVPLLLMDMWLLGRRAPLDIYGLEHTLVRTMRLMSDFDWESWPNFYEVNFHVVQEARMAKVVDSGELRVWSSPVRHIVPTIGLRIEALKTGRSMAYSCDTEPCDEVVELASKADLLIHEAGGKSYGHSSAAQAGEIARRAAVQSLYLIHYSTKDGKQKELVEEAGANFIGKIELAEDFMEIEL